MPDKRRVKRANYYRYVVITLTHEASHRCGSLRNLEAREQELASEGVGLGVALLQRRHDHAHRRAYLLVRSMERVLAWPARAASIIKGSKRYPWQRVSSRVYSEMVRAGQLEKKNKWHKSSQ